ncbi:DNA topoisomerase IB [Streptodolium elevatio]|uniref:DNA topoisomerase n=1 Tax=Streptodolium elevatio TaxID=3157996 RepID=A0ABV3DRA0_9ACTN
MRLRHSDIHGPGYGRVRSGRGFRYVDRHGRTLDDADEKARIKALAIPPAWTDVWVCPFPNGHIQAVGFDAAGRRQYLYHPEFRRRQEQSKHEHVAEVAATLPRLRDRVEHDLRRRGLCRSRVLACAVRLLDLGLFRVGDRGYTRDNDSYGLTTLLREHASVRQGRISFEYPGKSGRTQVTEVADEATRKAVRALLRRRDPGPRLLAYWEGGTWHEVAGSELNAYLCEASGTEMSAKDFRTWHATVMAAVGLAVSANRADDGTGPRRRAVARTVREVADYLGNTPTVCRASYIDPRVVELFEDGVTVAPALPELGADSPAGLPATRGAMEDAVRELLHRRPD